MYKWNDDISQFNSNAWAFNYRSIFYTNVVLDGLSKLKVQSDQQALYNNIKGSALFYRSLVFFHLAQIYAPPFDLNTANLDLGIPLKLGSDINEKVQRSTLSQTYDRIIKGLKEAIPLLQVTPLYKTRPSKPAIYLLLAKVYLAMNDYTNAFCRQTPA
ncbi:MAG: RagB/SusD family nutrient uptake outer membrane protein [Bacteroidota bacterium]